ncbi:hypothetical protein PR202_ga03918 [Eleusine coracana subsp. coracana]|uniref:Uncharacterized protein n=1 Tax=Eleusine coracana subsp. coracana TaxID=191504 RepID=A0AAV5BR08_ELECO|nr:hypothetical protein PR202_ga03918 [Eleusine coracana subsp. coracana]
MQPERVDQSARPNRERAFGSVRSSLHRGPFLAFPSPVVLRDSIGGAAPCFRGGAGRRGCSSNGGVTVHPRPRDSARVKAALRCDCGINDDAVVLPPVPILFGGRLLAGNRFIGDLEFCIGDVKINNHEVLGRPMIQRGPNCVANAYAKIMEISKRMKAIIQDKDPSLVPEMCPDDLVQKYDELIGNEESNGIKKVVHMAQILKEQGIRSQDGRVLYKVSDVSTIKRSDHETIATNLAKGIPLHAGFLIGQNIGRLKYCQTYKPPLRSRFIQKRRKVKGHAVVLIGAGRRNGRWYYFFLNSWRRFCVRSDSNGRMLRYGVGKLMANGLYRNVIRLSRFKEPGNARSLHHQNGTRISAVNLRLLMSLD